MRKLTLIETLVVVAIIVILAGTTYWNSINNEELNDPQYDLQENAVQMPTMNKEILFAKRHYSGKYTNYYVYTDIGRIIIDAKGIGGDSSIYDFALTQKNKTCTLSIEESFFHDYIVTEIKDCS